MEDDDKNVKNESNSDFDSYSDFFSKYDLQDDLGTLVSDSEAIKLLSAYLKLVKENQIARLPIFLVHGQTMHEIQYLCKATANSAESNILIISFTTFFEKISKEVDSDTKEPFKIVELIINKMEKEITRILEIRDHQEEFSTIVCEDIDKFLIICNNNKEFNQLICLTLLKKINELLSKLISEYDQLIIFCSVKTHNIYKNGLNHQTIINSLIEYLSIGEIVSINPPDSVTRSLIISEKFSSIYNAEAILPSAEHISQLTTGFSFSRLNHLLDIITTRTKAGLLGLSNFDDFVKNYFTLTSSFISYKEDKQIKENINSSMTNLVLPLTRRLIWSDYKSHIEELIVNEPQKFPEILRAAKKLNEIDYKIRLLLYDISAGGILTEKEPYVRLTEMKRLIEM